MGANSSHDVSPGAVVTGDVEGGSSGDEPANCSEIPEASLQSARLNEGGGTSRRGRGEMPRRQGEGCTPRQLSAREEEMPLSPCETCAPLQSARMDEGGACCFGGCESSRRGVGCKSGRQGEGCTPRGQLTERSEKTSPWGLAVLNKGVGGGNLLGTSGSLSRVLSKGTPLTTYYCQICLSNEPEVSGIKLGCGHLFCVGCILNYAASKVGEAALLTLQCPHLDLDTTLDVKGEPGCDFMIDDVVLRDTIGAPVELLEKYNRFKLMQTSEHSREVSCARIQTFTKASGARGALQADA